MSRASHFEARRSVAVMPRLDDALRCAKKATDFAEAARLAGSAGSADAAMLTWGRDLDAVLAARPTSGALTDEERPHVREDADRVLGIGTAARRGRGGEASARSLCRGRPRSVPCRTLKEGTTEAPCSRVATGA